MRRRQKLTIFEVFGSQNPHFQIFGVAANSRFLSSTPSQPSFGQSQAGRYAELSKTNKDQEVKFLDHVSASESLIQHLITENKRLGENIDQLRDEVVLCAAKDTQFDELQKSLAAEKQKNQKLSAENEQLRNMQHEGIFLTNRSERQEGEHVNNIELSLCVSGDESNGSPKRMSRKRTSDCSPCVSGDQINESSMRMTRKRAKLGETTDSAINNPLVSPRVELLSTSRELSVDLPKSGVSNKQSPLPECCRSNIDSGGPCTCLFQNLVECLTGMNVSIVDQPEHRCIRATHLSSAYSFSLTWMEEATQDEEKVMYSVSSLGTLATVAPEWMREDIIFSTRMLPFFFERVTRAIKA